MKRITAIVRSEKINDVTAALRAAGAKGFTYYDVKGHGRSVTHGAATGAGLAQPAADAGIVDMFADVLARTKFEIIAGDAEADKICEAIRKASVSGQRGDGIIYLEGVADVIRILSGERGEKAL